MAYTLTSQATGEMMELGSREWEKLLELAATSGGNWERQEDRDYNSGQIDSEEAALMAESVEGLLPYTSSSERSDQQPEETRRTREGLRESLGHEEDPLTFFGDPRRRHKAQHFVRLASLGAFQIARNY
jgi:hypothetical protein